MYGDAHKDDKYRKSMNGNSSIPRKPPWKETFKNNKVYFGDEFETVASGDMATGSSESRPQDEDEPYYDLECGEGELGDEEGDFEEGDEEFEDADAEELVEAFDQGIKAHNNLTSMVWKGKGKSKFGGKGRSNSERQKNETCRDCN
jgi:hypothetical protein